MEHRLYGVKGSGNIKDEYVICKKRTDKFRDGREGSKRENEPIEPRTE